MRTSQGMWKLSPSGLYGYEDCKACFWIEQHIGRAPSIPMRLNSAVDEKLKNRYDIFRRNGKVPPEVEKLKGVRLFGDQDRLNKWRNDWNALKYTNVDVGYVLSGMLDEVFILPDGKAAPADYKSSGDEPKEDKHKYYVLQLHAYALMLTGQGLDVGNKGFLIHYFTKDKTDPSLSMEFSTHIDELAIDLSAFEATMKEIVELLEGEYPGADAACRKCAWYEKRERASA